MEQQGFPPYPSPTSCPLCPLPPLKCHQMPPFPMGVTSQLGFHQAEELLAPCSSPFPWRAMEVFELQSKATFWHGKLLKSCPAGLNPARSPNGFPWPGKGLLPGAGASQLPAAKGQWLLQMWPHQRHSLEQLEFQTSSIPAPVGIAFQGEQDAGGGTLLGWRGQGPQ